MQNKFGLHTKNKNAASCKLSKVNERSHCAIQILPCTIGIFCWVHLYIIEIVQSVLQYLQRQL